jgi:tetratricopeptide (TPR) repeat protein
LAGREKALGDEHTDTLKSVNNLGILLNDKGDYEGAEALHRRALAGREKALGAEHPVTLGSVVNLGISLNNLGRSNEAIKLLRRFAALSESAQDAMAYNLACYECLEGNIDEARRLIAAHLEKHPNEKYQALADPDFTAIHGWILLLTQIELKKHEKQNE